MAYDDASKLSRQLRLAFEPAYDFQRLTTGIEFPSDAWRTSLQSVLRPSQQLEGVLRNATAGSALQAQLHGVLSTTKLPEFKVADVIRSALMPQAAQVIAPEVTETFRKLTIPSIDLAGALGTNAIDEARRAWQSMLRPVDEEMRVALAAFQRIDWTAVREAADGLIQELDAAADEEDAADEEAVSWLWRLPVTAQLALLVAVLKMLDEFSQWLAVHAGGDVPPDVRHGTTTLFALAAVLLMVVEQRSRPPR